MMHWKRQDLGAKEDSSAFGCGHPWLASALAISAILLGLGLGVLTGFGLHPGRSDAIRVAVQGAGGTVPVAGPHLVAAIAAGLPRESATAAAGLARTETEGATPRALAERLSAKASLKLDGAAVTDKSAGTVSALDLNLDLPGLDSRSRLDGNVVYNRETVELDVTLDPLQKILAGEAFAAKLGVTSALATVRYDGTAQQQPVPGLDGTLDLETKSAGNRRLCCRIVIPRGGRQALQSLDATLDYCQS